MKKKQQVTAKQQFIKKKKEMTSGVDDLATHEENDIQKFAQPKKQIQSFQQIQVKQIEDSSSEEDADIEDQNNPDEQSRFVLGLLQKNRINEKNSFDVPLVNLRELSAFNQTDEGDAWKHISASLDADSKIYGFRVDLVHQNTFKVLGGLHRTQVTDKQQQEEQQEYDQELRKRKLQNSGGENTLEKNPANLDTNKYDLEFEIDPLFQQTSAKFDEAGAKGLLMNNLTINENLMLALDSEVMQTKPLISTINIENFKQNMKSLNNLKLCPELTEFREIIFQKGQGLIDLKQNKTFADIMDPKPMVMDFQDDQQYDNMQEEYFDEGASMNSNQNFIQEQFQPENRGTQFYTTKFNVLNFEQAAANIGTGKVFETEKEQVAWLALDMNQQPKKKIIMQLQNEKTKKQKPKKKNGLPFVFDEEDDDKITRENVFQNKEKENYITKQQESFTQLNLLPRSYQIDRQDLYFPFQIAQLPKWEEVLQEGEFPDENLEYGGDDEYVDGAQNFNEGFRVQNGKLNIPIKELKNQVWQSLSKQIPLTSQSQGLQFNEVNYILPDILKVPKQKGNVSIQTCFVTMLHLANEEGLKFIQNDDENDFIIQREVFGH